MTFAEKLKDLRKANGMSQETLAEKLGVSRQAVTKWETDMGLPDIDNMVAVSKLFGISVDEFLSEKIETAISKGYLYESNTEYDIDGPKHFDIKLGGASTLRVIGADSEKIIIHLASNEIATLESDFKVKIDDIRGRIDVDIKRKNGMTEAKAKESLIIEAFIPNQYASHVEVECNCDELRFSNVKSERVEFDGKAGKAFIDSAETRLELDSNLDMHIYVNRFKGSLEINQISSTSRLTLPNDFNFRSVVKGVSNSVYYELNDSPTEDFSDPGAENVVELNGLKSELVIVKEA